MTGPGARRHPALKPVAMPVNDTARPTIRLGFAGFWDSFDPHDNFFTRLLARRYHVEVCAQPEYLIHSCIGRGRHDHLAHDGVRIFFTGENVPPDWHSTDWAFTFTDTSHARHFRLPLWALYFDPALLVKPPDYDPAAVLARKTGFCAFVVSNPLCRTRNEFFRRLSRYKPVSSGGKVLNTLGHRVADKRAFLAEHRFTIAFENESHPGYTTEKIAEAMLADSVPIYWGDPLVGRDFETRSFLSAHDTPDPRYASARPDLDALIERVIELDRRPDLLLAMLAQPWYRNNRVPYTADSDAILAQFTRIFTTAIEPVARRRGLARSLRLHRLPATAASMRRRLVRKYRQLRRNDG